MVAGLKLVQQRREENLDKASLHHFLFEEIFYSEKTEKSVSVITLHMNGLNIPDIKQRLSD